MITSHLCVTPCGNVAAYAKSTPHISAASLLDLHRSDALPVEPVWKHGLVFYSPPTTDNSPLF